MKPNHIKAISELIVCDARAEQLARAFTELTTRQIWNYTLGCV